MSSESPVSNVEFEDELSDSELSLIHYVSSLMPEDDNREVFSDHDFINDDISFNNEGVSQASAVTSFASDFGTQRSQSSAVTYFASDFETQRSQASVRTNFGSDIVNFLSGQDISSVQSDIDRQDELDIQFSQEEVPVSPVSGCQDEEKTDEEEEEEEEDERKLNRDRHRILQHMNGDERLEYMIRVILEETIPMVLDVKESQIAGDTYIELWNMILKSEAMSLCIPRIIEACDLPAYWAMEDMSSFSMSRQRDQDMVVLLLLVGAAAYMPRDNIVLRRLKDQLGRHRMKLSERVRLGDQRLSLTSILESGEHCPTFELSNCFSIKDVTRK